MVPGILQQARNPPGSVVVAGHVKLTMCSAPEALAGVGELQLQATATAATLETEAAAVVVVLALAQAATVQ